MPGVVSGLEGFGDAGLEGIGDCSCKLARSSSGKVGGLCVYMFFLSLYIHIYTYIYIYMLYIDQR